MSTQLIEALRAYRQADEDGILVIVSRQACDEAADEIERLRASLSELHDGRAVVLPKSRKHALDMLVIAEAGVRQLTN